MAQTNRFAQKQTTGVDQKVSLTRQLYECRPHMLDQYTVEGLLRSHSKMKAKEVEYLLIVARQNRASEAR